MDNLIISFIFNVLLGVVMFFMKQTNDTTKERLEKVEKDLERIKDGTVKKEDFREFKEELWLRFDKMEVSFDKRFQQLTKE